MPVRTMPNSTRLASARSALGCAFAVISLSAMAQSLDTVIVTASRTPQPLADALPHTTIITREDIERAQALDLPTLLAREAGVQFASNGGRGSATTLFVRGAPSRQVLVLVDGVPLSKQDASGAVSIEHLTLDNVERVEVVRGNVSALYGSGAIGGVIQVFTRSGDGVPRVDAAVEAGAFGFARASISASGSFGATSLAAGLAHQGQRGFSAQDAAANPAVNPDDDGYRNTSASASLRQRWAEGHQLGLTVSTSDGRLDYDSAFASALDTQRSRTRLATARLASEDRLGERWQSTLAATAQRDDARFHETGTFAFDARSTTRTRGVSWLNRFDLGDGWHADAGVEHERQSIDSDDGFGGVLARQRSVNAVLGGVDGKIDALTLQFNLRYDDIEDIGGQATGRAALGWQVAPQWKLIASAATAFNAPPLGYLYTPSFGNPNLQPERARSAELGVQWTADAQSLRATAFAQRISDELEFDLATSTFANLARTRNRGLEVSWGARLGRTDAQASLTSQRPIDEVTGQPRLRRSESLASLALSHDLGLARVGASWRYAGARPEVGGVTLEAYNVLDLTLQADVGPSPGGRWQVFGRIENVADARYQTASGYNQSPRAAFVGLRWAMR